MIAINTRKNHFAKVSKNLTRYRSKNNFCLDHYNNYMYRRRLN